MRFKRQTQDNVDVNMTPLIDVVFLLLIFFMVSTTFTDKTEIKLDLPQATGVAQMKQSTAIRLVISQQGDYAVNGAKLINNNFSTLKSAISKAAKGNVETPFIITADANTSHQSVVKVMDAAGQLGFTNLSITTVHPEN